MTSSAKTFRVVTDKDVADMNKPAAISGGAVDRFIMEVVVHIPVAVAIGISIYGGQQYGAFLWGIAPLCVALSVMLSRTYAMIQSAAKIHRWDVVVFLVMLGAFAFAWEAYSVHLGLVRFNLANAAAGLQTFGEEAMIAASIILGAFNVFSRRAYVTGHQLLTVSEADRKASESWSAWDRKRDNWNDTVLGGERRDRFGKMDAGKIKGRGKKPTLDDLQAAIGIAEKRGDRDTVRILSEMLGKRQADTPEAKRA